MVDVSAIESLAKMLISRKLKLVTAESCTGGGLSYFLTSIPGSSDWFSRSYVTYSNQAKMDMLGVNIDTLTKFGAVSENVALEMAELSLLKSNADVSVAITGIAGPSGGSDDKPVGTVWIAVAMKDKKSAKHYLFEGDRESIRLQAIEKAISQLMNTLS